jgi:alkylhydroperoxidase family enzyme
MASAKLAGLTDQQIEDIRFYQSSGAYDDKERATLRFADLVTRGAAAIDESVLGWLGTYYSDSEIVELVMVIGLANLVNRFNDTLQVQPDLG